MEGPEVASVVAVQLVAWPLVALLVARAVVGRVPVLPVVGVVVLLGSQALSLVVPGEPAWLSHGWFVAVPLLCATYPDGRFVPRWLTVPTLLAVAVPVVDLLSGQVISAHPGWAWFASAELALVLAQVHRYRRRATTAERLAVRWAVLGLILTPLAFVLIWRWFEGTIGGETPAETALAHLALLPVCVCFATGLLAPGLADVDRILRGLAAGLVIAAPVVLVVLVVGASDLRHPLGVGAALAALVAVATVPVARWVSAWLVYRGRTDVADAVADLGERLADQPRAAAVPTTFVAAVVELAVVDGARLAGPGILDVVQGHDPGERGGSVRVPVTYHGGWLADLVVAPRRGETGLTAHDRRVVEALAVHGAPALHGAVVLADLVDARSLLVRAHEEERRRLRQDLHDDLGPTLSGLALAAAALTRRAAVVDSALAEASAELAADIRAAVTQTREIAHGLRPPVLDDLGLVAAVRQRLTAPDDPLTVGLHAPADRLALPAAVDLAALRIVQEAVSNVRRHAGAARCDVTLELREERLHVTVDDDGVGLPVEVRPGVGLLSMRDRAAEVGGDLRLDRSPSGGVRVAVRLPLGATP